MSNNDIQLSKSLSWLLRHGAVRVGLQLSPEGYLNVTKILNLHNFKVVDDIKRVVANNDKQRFKLRSDPATSVLEVKAYQGHTIIQVTTAELIPILEPKYQTVLHGTYLKCWPQIKRQGLSRVRRQHIHLAKGPLGDKAVISGVRKTAQVYIHIDLAKALADGIKFFESENGVILTSGNENGYLKPKYFAKVVLASTG